LMFIDMVCRLAGTKNVTREHDNDCGKSCD
jgi:hypothetical protein